MLNFVVIGCMKGGTTSLYRYLSSHPEIDLCRIKELNFFNNDDNWRKGIDWYFSYFRTDRKVRGDVNPNYAMHPFSSLVPERIFSLFPELKIVYLVRCPIARARAHILHNVSNGKETRCLDEVIAGLERGHDPFGYLEFSKYCMQIDEYLRFFSMGQILVVRSEDLLGDRMNTMRVICRHVGVSPDIIPPGSLDEVVHATSRKRVHPPFMKRLVANEFTGELIKASVSGIKMLLPSSIYEKVRCAIFPAPRAMTFENTHLKAIGDLVLADHEALQRRGLVHDVKTKGDSQLDQ